MYREYKRNKRIKKIIYSSTIFIIIILLVFSFFMHKEESITGSTIMEIEEEEIKLKEFSSDPEVYFCPKDKCDEKLIDFIDSANSFIHCAFFDLDLNNVITVLKEKSEDIDVKIVVDEDNYEYVQDLDFVKTDDRRAYMHNKFCIADYTKIITGSFNPTVRGAYYNNNNIIIVNSEYLANNYEKEFLELWNNIFGFGSNVENPIFLLNDKKIENYFCPEDNCAKQVEEEINKSQSSIYFMTFSFTHGGIATSIAKKIQNGIEVKGIFEKSQSSQYSKKDLIEFQGGEVKFDNNPYNMHNKVFIIDEKTVITGSFNPSNNANKNNDENILIIEDEVLARSYLDEFDYIWNYKEEISDAQIKPNNVIIYEVLYDAVGSDKDKEFVRLYNPTNKEINLNYYKLTDNDNNFVLKYRIKEWDYLTLTADNGLFSLNNSDSLLILKDQYNNQLDYVVWGEKWNLTANEGYKLKRNSTDFINSKDQWKVVEE